MTSPYAHPPQTQPTFGTGTNVSGNTPIDNMGGLLKAYEPPYQPNFGAQVTDRTFDSLESELDQMQVIQTVINLFNYHMSVVSRRCLPAVLTQHMNFGIRTTGLTPTFASPTPETATSKEITYSEEFRQFTMDRYGLTFSGSLDALDSQRGKFGFDLRQKGMLDIYANMAEYKSILQLVNQHNLSQLNKMRFGGQGYDFHELNKREVADFASYAREGEEALRSMAGRANEFISQETNNVPDTMLIPSRCGFLISHNQSVKTFTLTLQNTTESRIEEDIVALARVGEQMDIFQAVPSNTYRKFAGADPMVRERIVSEYFILGVDDAENCNMYKFRPEQLGVRIFDYNKQSWEMITFKKALDNAHLFEENGDYSKHLREWYEKNYTDKERVCEHFFVSKDSDGDPQLIEYMGQMKPETVGDGFRLAAQSVLGQLFGNNSELRQKYSSAIAGGLRLRRDIMGQLATAAYITSLKSLKTKEIVKGEEGIATCELNIYGSPNAVINFTGMTYPLGYHGWNGMLSMYHNRELYKDAFKSLDIDALSKFVEAIYDIAEHIKKFAPESNLLNPENTPSYIKIPSRDPTYALIQSLWAWDDCLIYRPAGATESFRFVPLLGPESYSIWENRLSSYDKDLGPIIEQFVSSCTSSEQKEEMARKLVFFSDIMLNVKKSDSKAILTIEYFTKHSKQISAVVIPGKDKGYATIPSGSQNEMVIPLAWSESMKIHEDNEIGRYSERTHRDYAFETVFKPKKKTTFASSHFNIDAGFDEPRRGSKFAHIGSNMGVYRPPQQTKSKPSSENVSFCFEWPSFTENMHHIDRLSCPMERMVAKAIACTPSNGLSWKTYIEAGGFPLFKILLFRPMIRLNMGCLIAMVAGVKTGWNAYMKPSLMFGTNPTNQTYNCTMIFRSVPVIKEPNGIFLSLDTFLRGHKSGWGSEFIRDFEEMEAVATGTARRSLALIAAAVPWNYYPEDDVLSVAGKWYLPSDIKGIDVNKQSYPTGSYYDHIYRFSEWAVPHDEHIYPETSSGKWNAVAYRGTCLRWTEKIGGTQGNWGSKHMGTGHLAELSYIGNTSCIDGMAAAKKESEQSIPIYG